MAQTISLELQAKQKQSLKQMQRLIMSPQMQQAISLLQLPLLELSNRIEEELTENLMLENADEAIAVEEQEEESRSWQEDEEENLEKGIENELDFVSESFDVFKKLDQDFYDYFAESGRYSSKRNTEEDRMKTFMENSIAIKPSLFEHLMTQVRETFEKEEERAIAEVIIGNLDASGFFTEPITEVALYNNFDENQILSVLNTIQNFDPYGIGARGLQESLLLQLKNFGKQDSLAYKIIENHYEALVHNRIPQIQKALGCTEIEITKAIESDIVKLDLHPGAGYDRYDPQPLVPDITIYQEGETLRISVNDESLPQLRFNRRYLHMLDDPTLSSEVREFIEQKVQSARWFLQNIFQRNRTLERIGEVLANKQKNFFSSSDGKLSPLTMKIVAEELNLHESTVARAVANKYLNSPRGLFSLRFFFTNAYQTDNGYDISSKTVRDKLIEFIDKENKSKPLSDEALSLLLQKQGVTCARRTVAKYRTALKIGNAHQRRKYS